jgi:hypothetical protein
MTPKSTMLAALTVAMTACSVKTENNEVVAYGDRIAVRIMCPGLQEFSGYYANTKGQTGLTDSHGRAIGSVRNCVWVKA